MGSMFFSAAPLSAVSQCTQITARRCRAHYEGDADAGESGTCGRCDTAISSDPLMPFALCRRLLKNEQHFAAVVVEFEYVARYFVGCDLNQCRFVCRFGGA